MICRNCGADFNEGAILCLKCGSDLRGGVNGQSYPPPPLSRPPVSQSYPPPPARVRASLFTPSETGLPLRNQRQGGIGAGNLCRNSPGFRVYFQKSGPFHRGNLALEIYLYRRHQAVQAHSVLFYGRRVYLHAHLLDLRLRGRAGVRRAARRNFGRPANTALRSVGKGRL